MDKLISVRDLRFSAGGRDILRSVSFTLKKGEILAVAGESGSGKSTLARILAGAAAPHGGTITPGVDILQRSYPVTGRDICLIPQNSMNSFNPTMKMKKQVAEGALLHRSLDREETRRRIVNLMEELSLPRDTLDLYPHELSGGMKQRFSFIMGILTAPDILILDEVTTGLDEINKKLLTKQIKKLRETTGIILITHDLELIEEIAQRVIVLKNGLPVEWGDVSQVITTPRHPYVQELVSSQIKNLSGRITPLKERRGIPMEGSCPFLGHCPHAMRVCLRKQVFKDETSAGGVACWKYYLEVR